MLLPHPPLPEPSLLVAQPLFESNQEKGSESWEVTQPGRTSLLAPLTLTFLVRSQASLQHVDSTLPLSHFATSFKTSTRTA